MKIIINRSKDLRRDTFRSGGKGGQNQNKVETGVRYTHLATGISAESRRERHQHQNDQIALSLLLDKLREHYAKELRKKAAEAYRAKDRIGFGKQRRTYKICGHQRVVDHRTGQEGHPLDVLNGGLDKFIAANLKI